MHVQLVEIHATGHEIAGIVAAVPVDCVASGIHLAGHPCANFMALQVADQQLHGAGFQHAEGSASGGVEGIRTILLQLVQGETAPAGHL